MTRQEEIIKQVDEEQSKSKLFESNDWRAGFIQGAKWADKTMLEKVCEWLEFNYTEYLDNSRLGINMKEMVEDFRKAMEE